MTPGGSVVSRLVAVAAAAVLLIGGSVALSAVADTQSAWTDAVATSAQVTAGDWSTPTPTASSGCTVVYTATQQPVPGATCTISGSSITQWTDGTNVVRDYYISLSSSTSGPGIQILVTVDLSTLPGGGAWTWGAAATVASGAQTVTSTCAALPVLSARMPDNYGSAPQLWQRVVQSATMPMASTKTCR